MGIKTARLRVLMEELAIMTEPECATACRIPRSCCDPMYCQFAEEYALDQFQIKLPRINEGPNELLFMGPTGCTVEPYLRPMCTFHTCDINNLGFKRGDVDGVWTEGYFDLREKCDMLMYEVEQEGLCQG